MLKDFDLVDTAGERNRAVVKEFHGVQVGRELTVELTSKTGKPLLCGIEITTEDERPAADR